MTTAGAGVTYKSPLHQMTQTTPTVLWNDSASIGELTYAIEHGAEMPRHHVKAFVVLVMYVNRRSLGARVDVPLGQLV